MGENWAAQRDKCLVALWAQTMVALSECSWAGWKACQLAHWLAALMACTRAAWMVSRTAAHLDDRWAGWMDGCWAAHWEFQRAELTELRKVECLVPTKAVLKDVWKAVQMAGRLVESLVYLMSGL